MKKIVLLIFLLLILSKIFIGLFINVPLGFSDSLTYIDSGKAIFDTQSVSELSENKYPPLYPLLISSAFLFEDMEKVHNMIYLINAILSSLIIFPAYLLAKEFLNKRKSVMVATLVGFLPPIFTFSFYIMSENIFYPLVLLSLYLIFKSFKERELKWDILAGLSIGFCFLTKILAIFFFPLVIILVLLHFRNQIKKKLVLLAVALVTIFPWLIIKGTSLGYTAQMANTTTSLFMSARITWFFLYIDYVIIGLGIIFFILSLNMLFKYLVLNKKKKLLVEILFFAVLFLLIIAANHSGGGYESYQDYRILGRYIAAIFPLILIAGFIELDKIKKIPKFSLFLTTVFVGITTPLLLFDIFFPINNTSWIHIGIGKYFLESLGLNYKLIITGILLLICVIFFFIKKLRTRKLFRIFMVYFIIICLLNCAVMVYDSEYKWKQTEPVELGLWFNENIEDRGIVMFDIEEFEDSLNFTDENDITEQEKRATLAMAYWLRGNFKLDTVDNYLDYDYIVTKKYLDLEIIKTGKEGTNIYKNGS